MHTYKSKSRFNMLLYINGNVLEIRPQQVFESTDYIDSKYVEDTTPKIEEPKKALSKLKTKDNVNE